MGQAFNGINLLLTLGNEETGKIELVIGLRKRAYLIRH
jgi:hypothetical protein